MCFCLYFVNSFYRFVLELELMLMVNDNIGLVVKFLDISELFFLTFNMIIFEGWLVEIVYSNCDFDNIYLKDVSYYIKLYKGR